MITRAQRATYGTASLLVVAAICAGCTTGTGRGPPSGPDPDRRLQPAENITPLVNRDVVARYGAGLMAALNTVSARLDSASLRALNAQAENTGGGPWAPWAPRAPRQVAERWLHAQGLLGKERADR